MIAYRKERVDHAILYFAKEHYRKTKKYLSQTGLYKYLAFFEFRYLKKTGDMPLELDYIAMPYGPVPKAIYESRENPGAFPLVIFESSAANNGTGYIVKPNGTFKPDYFAELELEEMEQLIEIFAQRWVTSSVMSDASHREIKSWIKARAAAGSNAPPMNPIFEFGRDIESLPAEELRPEEERILIHRKVSEYAR
jgi:hypothetical protein